MLVRFRDNTLQAQQGLITGETDQNRFLILVKRALLSPEIGILPVFGVVWGWFSGFRSVFRVFQAEMPLVPRMRALLRLDHLDFAPISVILHPFLDLFLLFEVLFPDFLLKRPGKLLFERFSVQIVAEGVFLGLEVVCLS